MQSKFSAENAFVAFAMLAMVGMSLWGKLVKKRPLMQANHWSWVMSLFPVILLGIGELFSSEKFDPISLALGSILFLASWLWVYKPGYYFSGTTKEAFVEGLNTALRKWNIPYSIHGETIQIPQEGIELRVPLQWRGCTICYDRRQAKSRAKELANLIDDYFREHHVPYSTRDTVFVCVIAAVVLTGLAWLRLWQPG